MSISKNAREVLFWLFLYKLSVDISLMLQDVSREQMGAYLCIASNKVPPSVSKRIKLVVECEYMVIGT
jgi:hypothetical protein